MTMPQRVTLRAEEDNEELSLPMQPPAAKRRSTPMSCNGVGKSACMNGQPRRRYSL